MAFYKKIANGKNNISYNMFGSVTGRLTVSKNSFPILTFPKQYRSILFPQNDWFVVFDMNAAELRTAMALNGKEQVEGDLHAWSAKNVFKGELDRAEAKSTATAWLYNSHSPLSVKYDKELSQVYDKQGLLNKYWIDGYIHTPYGRKIEADEHHAISYLNQSTFIDLFHRQILKVDDALKGKKSFVSFMVHDEFVLDVTNDEKNDILEIIKILQNTSYGKFPVNVKAGKNYGELKKLNLKVD
jgi:DNA polymerase I-like protein with 3'-5' exonuclease and polymerase domains